MKINEVDYSNMLDDEILEQIFEVSEGNQESYKFLKYLIKEDNSFFLTDFPILGIKGIVGDKLYKLIDECCKERYDIFKMTLFLIKCNVYSDEEINNNLQFARSIPFISEEISGIYNFDSTSEEFNEYVRLQKKEFSKKYNERLEKHNAVGIK